MPKYSPYKSKNKERKRKVHDTTNLKYSIVIWPKHELVITCVERRSLLEEGSPLTRVHTTTFHFLNNLMLRMINLLVSGCILLFKHPYVMMANLFGNIDYTCYIQLYTCQFKVTCKWCLLPMVHMVNESNKEQEIVISSSSSVPIEPPKN